MNMSKSILPLSLFLILACTLSGCKGTQAAYDDARDKDLNKVTMGDERTANYAKKVITVENNTVTDPYTGSKDKANYVGKEPIAKKQLPLDHVKP